MNSRPSLYILIIICAVSVFLAATVIFADNPSIPNSVSQGIIDSGSECVGETCNKEKKLSLIGMVEELTLSDKEKFVPNYKHLVTHVITSNGVITAYLYTDDDKLKLVQGMELEVVGEVTSQTDANIPIIKVTELEF